VPRSGAYGTFSLKGRYGVIAETVDANDGRTLSTYDEWGRSVAVWGPLDRVDRPRLQYRYADPRCEGQHVVVGANTGSASPITEMDCGSSDVLALRSPGLISTLTWDDQFRRCVAGAGGTVSCSADGVTDFADEQPPGDYEVIHTFADGQVHRQDVANGKPDWTVSGISDFDAQGRLSRAYKVRYISQAATASAACPPASAWCDSASLAGDPLRSGVASIQV